MHSASSLLAYRAFATTFEAMEANYFLREHVRQVPGLRKRDENPEEQEFVAEENAQFRRRREDERKPRRRHGQDVERLPAF
jgi:hypothetical protein